MNEQDINKILENMQTPEIDNQSHQDQLRYKLIERHESKKNTKVNSFLINSIFMNKFVLVPALVLVAAIGIGSYFYIHTGNKQSSKQSSVSQTASNVRGNSPLASSIPTAAQPQTMVGHSAPMSALALQTVVWHDPNNSIYGFHYDLPVSWVELPGNSENNMSYASCSLSTSKSCDPSTAMEFSVQIRSGTGGFPNIGNDDLAGETTISDTTTTIAGASGREVVKQLVTPGHPTQIITDISLINHGNSYFMEMIGLQDQQINNILQTILSSFGFDQPQAAQAPTEYQMLFGVITWQLTYQDKNSSDFPVCANGNKGSTAEPYVFNMSTQGLGAAPGDIATPYNQVVKILQSNGWTECGTPIAQQSGPQYQQVFIKNGKLIGVDQSYSNGVGNYLNVVIQY